MATQTLHHLEEKDTILILRHLDENDTIRTRRQGGKGTIQTILHPENKDTIQIRLRLEENDMTLIIHRQGDKDMIQTILHHVNPHGKIFSDFFRFYLWNKLCDGNNEKSRFCDYILNLVSF